ncbi:transglutaminase family protein [Pelagibius sp. 7325]|uniref:transglutaminase-like domain-containing protein n=1 Tax=Pelagibius sp. 7325 TaxID=3131994 RepID=UPI0030EC6565
MKIEAGFTLGYDCPQPTPMLLTLRVHPSRQPDLLSSDSLSFDPPLPSADYTDSFGNICTRIVAPAGVTKISCGFEILDSGEPDLTPEGAVQNEIMDLPDDVLLFLLGSRYCDTERLADLAGKLFNDTPPGWARVQAICDYVHQHIEFNYMRADSWRTAYGGYSERTGVCRDFAHLAITLCRCMNIPARYCTGYLGDIGVPPDGQPMDFSAWFEVYLGNRWYTADARHNKPRTGRILMARGRDATDVALATIFGPSLIAGFDVVTEEVPEA